MAPAKINSNWSELLPDLIEVITSHLSFSDVNRFSAVCKQWRFIAKQRRHAPIPQLPWVVLTENPESGKRKLYNMSEKRHYHIDIPELRGGYCVGSSFGWLFIVSSKLEGYLVNPFNKAHYRFPPLPPYTKDLNLGHVVDGKITYKRYGTTWTLKDLQKMTIKKAVLSDDPNKCKDFMTIIIFGEEDKMAFCRPQDKKWTVIRKGYDVDDVICYKGSIYALGGSNSLFAVDFGPKPKMKMIKRLPREFHDYDSRYLVDFFGKHLLFVHREVNDDYSDSDDNDDDDLADQHDDFEDHDLDDGNDDDDIDDYDDDDDDNDNVDDDNDQNDDLVDHNEEDVMVEEDLDHGIDVTDQNQQGSGDYNNQYHPVTSFFVVFEFDLEKKTWHEWKDLDGNALFLGSNRAIAIRASKIPDCKVDCIYYTSCSSDQDLVTNDYGYDDHGVYNYTEDSMEKFYEDHIPTTSLPTWLVPNP